MGYQLPGQPAGTGAPVASVPAGHDCTQSWRIRMRFINGHSIPWWLRNLQSCASAPGKHARCRAGWHRRNRLYHRSWIGPHGNYQPGGRQARPADGHERRRALRPERECGAHTRGSWGWLCRFHCLRRAVQGYGDIFLQALKAADINYWGRDRQAASAIDATRRQEAAELCAEVRLALKNNPTTGKSARSSSASGSSTISAKLLV